MAETDVEIQIDHAGETHEVGLGEDDDAEAGEEKIIHAIVGIREAENGPVPDKIEEKKDHGERVVDAAAIVALRLHLFAADLALIFQRQAFIEGEDTLVYKYGTSSATGALHSKQCRQQRRFFSGCHNGCKDKYFTRVAPLA